MGEQAVADTLVLPKQLELTPALRNLIETVVPSGSHCLNVGRRARPVADYEPVAAVGLRAGGRCRCPGRRSSR